MKKGDVVPHLSPSLHQAIDYNSAPVVATIIYRSNSGIHLESC
jgi:hypothetical protein